MWVKVKDKLNILQFVQSTKYPYLLLCILPTIYISSIKSKPTGYNYKCRFCRVLGKKNICVAKGYKCNDEIRI